MDTARHNCQNLPGSQKDHEQELNRAMLPTGEKHTLDEKEALRVLKYLLHNDVANVNRLCYLCKVHTEETKGRDYVIATKWQMIQGFLLAIMEEKAYEYLKEQLKRYPKFENLVVED